MKGRNNMAKNVKTNKPEVEKPVVNSEAPISEETVVTPEEVKTEEVVAPEVKEDPVVETAPEPTPVKEEVKPVVEEKKVDPVTTNVANIKAGAYVKLKGSATKTVTGVEIPAFAYKNTYKVKKVLPNRILIVANTLQYAVTKDDVILV